jgi:predicted dinucleotide-binding enzyme
VKIGILGTGHIGKTLARTLAAARHEVKVANSRGPETIDAETLATGARAVPAAEVVTGVEVIILSIPLKRLTDVRPLLADVAHEAVVIDTSNYYPGRDGVIDAIDAGQVESLWVVEQLGRPVVKAWNAIGSASFADLGKSVGSPDRIAIPVAADRQLDRDIAMQLVDDSGMDAFDAGSLAESWRQQPGAPAYCTGLRYEEMAAALAAAEKPRLPNRRDLAVAVIQERLGDAKTNPDTAFLVALNRAIYM